jgi:hypothetical protein
VVEEKILHLSETPGGALSWDDFVEAVHVVGLEFDLAKTTDNEFALASARDSGFHPEAGLQNGSVVTGSC